MTLQFGFLVATGDSFKQARRCKINTADLEIPTVKIQITRDPSQKFQGNLLSTILFFFEAGEFVCVMLFEFHKILSKSRNILTKMNVSFQQNKQNFVLQTETVLFCLLLIRDANFTKD